MKHTILLFFLTICLISPAVNGQINERVYLQTDKQFYLAGELLWFKLHTTDKAGKLLSYSKIGYVELLHDSIPEVQVKIDIQDGIGTGWIELPVLLPTGYYRMIAYTRFMRNEGESAYFEKMIAIVNPFHQNDELYFDDTHISFSFQSAENYNPTFDMSTDKSSYSIREQGAVHIKGLPAEPISLSVSIAGIDPVLDVSGTIEPSKQQATATNTPLGGKPFLPEFEGAIIDGALIDLATENRSDASHAVNLLSFPGDEIHLFAGQGYADGSIAFYTQCVTGKQELTTTAITLTDNKYRIDVQSPFATHSPQNLPPFRPDSTWQDYLQLRFLSIQLAQAYMADSLSKIREIISCTDLYPQRRYILDDWTRFSSMREVFIEFIASASIRQTNDGVRFTMLSEDFMTVSTNILVLLDNIPIANHELMANYNPLLIKTIDMHFGQYIFGGHRFDGIIAFYSYKNDYPGISFSENTQIFDYEGTRPYRYFYMPDYDEVSVYSPLPDFRHTLLWNPDVQTDGQHSIVIPFTTSDITGDYRIMVEGLTRDGQLLRSEARFRVNPATLSGNSKSSELLMAEFKPVIQTKPAVQSEALKTDTIKTEVAQPVSAPVALPASASVSQPVSTPVSAPVSQPVVASVSQPVSAPVSQSVATPVSQPEVSTVTPEKATATSTSQQANATTPPTVPASTMQEVLAKVKIEPGQRLTLIAEKYYGNRIFWVYLYEYNKATIGSNPNRVLPGMEILIPAKEIYDIDAKNPASVEKANALQRRLVGGN